MDPFRDELAAAHAKIAELEARIHELQSARVDPKHQAKSSQPSFLLLFAAGVATILMIAAGFFIYRQTRQPSSSGPVTFKGIATAEPAQNDDVIPPVVNPGAVASSSAKPKASAKCNCTPGDPLCTCL